MSGRTRYVYRLDITYPPNSFPFREDWDPAWHPNGYTPTPVNEMGRRWDLAIAAFEWPRERVFLSQSGAEHRADVFRQYGATVTVVRSNPITWPTTEAGASGEGSE
jgi:hypothetical protein